MIDHSGTIVIPLHVERAFAEKQRRVTGRIAVSRISRQHVQLVEQTLASESVRIERVPRGERIDHIPPVREEGDTIIIPVVEEVLAIERRLILKEEVRVRRVRTLKQHRERVQLRKQELVISRDRVSEATAVPGGRPEVNSTTLNKEK
jgi:stress response protein YsnF